ncbi:MAG: hypothetical protein Q4C95_02090 [Planctomycetia bacterium]|nr:hypothetical protein [Planctomycetia bacterium]
MPKNRSSCLHPSQESDELIFEVCQRFLNYYCEEDDSSDTIGKKGPAAKISNWLKNERGRPDLTREKIYPLLREAFRRNFLILKSPVDVSLKEMLQNRFKLDERQEIDIVKVEGSMASANVSSYAADKVIELIGLVAEEKRHQAIQEGKNPDEIKVHLGIGAGYATMLVAKRLALQVNTREKSPSLVLHTISSGGFFVEEPHKSPITYFSYFNNELTKIEYVALFSETFVNREDYKQIRKSPSYRRCFDLKDEIDIIITSLASADDIHSLLRQNLEYMIKEKAIPANSLNQMFQNGFIGDVQFRPYSQKGVLNEGCPIHAVALFELNEMVQFVNKPGKHVVLVGGPCGECGSLKTEALRPLLANKNLRLWNHLILDIKTANELLKTPNKSI